MYVTAIEQADQFTKPIHTIMRTYGGQLLPGASTIFFVNEQGVAITCKHVAELLMQADAINARYQQFRAERSRLTQNDIASGKLATLEAAYGYAPETTIQVKNNFLNTVDTFEKLTFHIHPTLDLAIIIFEGFRQIHYAAYARFIKDTSTIKPGKMLCRLGYPFPEFSNFKYNAATDDIEWTNTGQVQSPKFPMDGMVTRFGSDGRQIISIEMSTPGLRGQSGGPLFDANGLVYGMQYMTSHLHLGFDMRDKEIWHQGQTERVSNYPFLHVGHCIHADRIKEFLGQHGIKFYEE